MKYRLINYELNSEENIEAPGIAEAMLKYLPWPTLQLKINYSPGEGFAEVEDLQTNFLYRLQVI
jgi:hypothetical protein